MDELTAETLEKVSTREFGVLLFYAKGCKHCETIKPIFEHCADVYSRIGFFKAEIGATIEHYSTYADLEQEVAYIVTKNELGEEVQDEAGNKVLAPILQRNADGSPKLVKKIIVPSFYVYHTAAKSEENPYGFIGGFDGSDETELKAVCDSISGLPA